MSSNTSQGLQTCPNTGVADNIKVEGRQPWFVAQLKPNGLARARENLLRQGFGTFMPMQVSERGHAQVVRPVLRPLFPGYVFVRYDPAITQWRVINNTFGILRLVSIRPNVPQIVPAGFMQALFLRCGTGDVILPPEGLKRGDRVRVLKGPFRDFVAEVEHLSGMDRVTLLLDLMGRAARAEFARQDLEIA